MKNGVAEVAVMGRYRLDLASDSCKSLQLDLWDFFVVGSMTKNASLFLLEVLLILFLGLDEGFFEKIGLWYNFISSC